jgi:hypothetical protein
MLVLAIDTSGKDGSIALARATDQNGDEVEIIQVVPLTGGTFSAQLASNRSAAFEPWCHEARYRRHCSRVRPWIVYGSSYRIGGSEGSG